MATDFQSVALPVELPGRSRPHVARGGRATQGKRKTEADRFWEKVDRSGGPDACWIWTAARSCYRTGPQEGRPRYGVLWFRERYVGAHVAAMLMAGATIPPGHEVMHTCDEPACVNPKHLRIATHAENMLDMARKGRALGLPRRRRPATDPSCTHTPVKA